MSLLKTQRNAIYKAVESSGLTPREFRWENRDAEPLGFIGSEAEALVHTPTGFYCMIDNASVGGRIARNLRDRDQHGDYLLQFTPGSESRVQTVLGVDVETALGYVHEWLVNLQREATEPDLWAQIAAEGEVFSDAISGLAAANTPFKADERKRIAQGLDEIRAQLAAQHELSEQQLTAIDKGFAALKAASERVGRKDWVLMLGGTLMGIIGGAALPPNVVKGLFHIVGEVFQWLLQQGRLLPPFP